MLRDPHFNKGLAFSEKERDAHYLRGLLPPAEFSLHLQVVLSNFFNRNRPYIVNLYCVHQINYNLLAGEENTTKHSPVSGSIAEIHGIDGPAGICP